MNAGCGSLACCVMVRLTRPLQTRCGRWDCQHSLLQPKARCDDNKNSERRSSMERNRCKYVYPQSPWHENFDR
jgi:hypothetical protein